MWRGKHTFAIAQHKHHRSIYEEADANKRRKRYARPLIDLHMKIYRYEGMQPWDQHKKTFSGKIYVSQNIFLLLKFPTDDGIQSTLLCDSANFLH